MAEQKVESGRIATGAVTGDKVAANAIRANNIAAGTITGNLIADGSISGNNIVENAIRGNNIVDGTITGNLIASGAISSDLFDSNPVFTGNVSLTGVVTAYNQIGSNIAITGAYTMGANSFGNLHFCSGTTADYTLTLPAVSGNTGRIVTIQMSNTLTKLVTVDGNGSEMIDGALTRIMWANESCVLYCDGTAWRKVGGRSIPMVGAITPSATQTISNNTDTKRTGMNTTFGADNGVPGMSDTTNSRVVIQRPSKYRVGGAWRISNIGSGANMEVRLYISGAEYFINSRVNATGDWPVLQVFSTYAHTTTGEYWELYCKHFVGSNQTAFNSQDTFILVEEIPQW
jgi:hypothetical protein